MKFTSKYPIYIPSKGRALICQTMRAMKQMGVEYKVIVEEQEYKAYCKAVGRGRVLVLPQRCKDEYQTMLLDDADKSTGSGPARNFAREHSDSFGAKRHWVVDDNIRCFYRMNRNLKNEVRSPKFFLVMEEFCDRYTNIAMAGPHYATFIPRRSKRRPYKLNTRIYSCNLIRNDLNYPWRCRYNEDTDLSLRLLKDGWVTCLFTAFQQEKYATQSVAGGNTDEFYAEEGTAPKSEMLYRLHPDVTKLVYRWGRPHHYIDYKVFKGNKLILKRGYKRIKISFQKVKSDGSSRRNV